MRTHLILATLAAATLSTAAGAQTATFGGGLASPGTGFTLIDKFDTTNGLSDISGGVQVQTGSDGSGASPANSIPFGTSYLSVLGGGSATYSLASLLPRAVQFDWGSLDGYNTLTIRTLAGGLFTFVPGSPGFPPNADHDGNQVNNDTNGRFTFSLANLTSNDRISSLTFASSGNSFEVDNLAVSGAVPEPASWALMIGGFGLVGYAMRRRKAAGVAFA